MTASIETFLREIENESKRPSKLGFPSGSAGVYIMHKPQRDLLIIGTYDNASCGWDGVYDKTEYCFQAEPMLSLLRELQMSGHASGTLPAYVVTGHSRWDHSGSSFEDSASADVKRGVVDVALGLEGRTLKEFEFRPQTLSHVDSFVEETQSYIPDEKLYEKVVF